MGDPPLPPIFIIFLRSLQNDIFWRKLDTNDIMYDMETLNIQRIEIFHEDQTIGQIAGINIPNHDVTYNDAI